jgi:hypothetical protein
MRANTMRTRYAMPQEWSSIPPTTSASARQLLPRVMNTRIMNSWRGSWARFIVRPWTICSPTPSGTPCDPPQRLPS